MFTQTDRAVLQRIDKSMQQILPYLSYLPLILKTELKTMSELTDAIAELQIKVEADTTVDQSAITLLGGLTALIKNLQDQVAQAADVPAAVAAVKAFSASLAANQQTLSDAVTANTPAASA